MAQLRRDHALFIEREVLVVVVGPESASRFQKHWKNHELQFVGLPDPKHQVLSLFGQEVNLFKLGRMPAQVIVDRGGMVRYVHYGHHMADIPSNEELFGLLDNLKEEIVEEKE